MVTSSGPPASSSEKSQPGNCRRLREGRCARPGTVNNSPGPYLSSAAHCGLQGASQGDPGAFLSPKGVETGQGAPSGCLCPPCALLSCAFTQHLFSARRMGSESTFLGSDPSRPASPVALGSDLTQSFSFGSTARRGAHELRPAWDAAWDRHAQRGLRKCWPEWPGAQRGPALGAQGAEDRSPLGRRKEQCCRAGGGEHGRLEPEGCWGLTVSALSSVRQEEAEIPALQPPARVLLSE